MTLRWHHLCWSAYLLLSTDLLTSDFLLVDPHTASRRDSLSDFDPARQVDEHWANLFLSVDTTDTHQEEICMRLSGWAE